MLHAPPKHDVPGAAKMRDGAGEATGFAVPIGAIHTPVATNDLAVAAGLIEREFRQVDARSIERQLGAAVDAGGMLERDRLPARRTLE